MMLKFHAKAGDCCPWPNSHHYGQVRRYVGRQYTAPNEAKGTGATWPAKAEPDEVDAASPHAEHLIRYCAKGNIWPADEATAAACGVAFTKLERGKDGEWLSAAPKTAKPSKE
jgi:hypothetical protein